MGALAFLIVMGVLAVIGLGAALTGLIGLIISVNKKCKLLCGIFAAVLVVGILITAAPCILVGDILMTNTVPPTDFVETEIVIEGNLYENDSFTADGVTYQTLPLMPQSEVCYSIAEPVFSYMPEGVLNRAQWCNLYRLENGQNFDLIWDGYGTLYCPADQAEAVLEHYANCLRAWFYYSDVPLSDEAAAAMETFLLLEEGQETELNGNAVSKINVCCYSDDGIVLLQDIWLLATEGCVYAELSVTYDSESESVLYTGYPLPEELAVPLLADIMENAY